MMGARERADAIVKQYPPRLGNGKKTRDAIEAAIKEAVAEADREWYDKLEGADGALVEERQARRDAELLVWGLARNLNGDGEPYICRSGRDWFFRLPSGAGCSLGYGTIPILTPVTSPILKKAKEEQTDG